MAAVTISATGTFSGLGRSARASLTMFCVYSLRFFHEKSVMPKDASMLANTVCAWSSDSVRKICAPHRWWHG